MSESSDLDKCIGLVLVDALAERGEQGEVMDNVSPEIVYDGEIYIYPAVEERPPIVRLRFHQYGGDRLHSETLGIGDLPTMRARIHDALERAAEAGVFEKMGRGAPAYIELYPEPRPDCRAVLSRASRSR